MPHQTTGLTLAIALGAAAATLPAHAFDYSFLNQSPIRYFNDADAKMMDATLNQVLNDPKDEVSKSWRNDQTGSNGEVKALYSYAKDGLECRRIQLTNYAKQARNSGNAKSLLDMCRVGDTWKILDAPR
jgi:hypothetical protein